MLFFQTILVQLPVLHARLDNMLPLVRSLFFLPIGFQVIFIGFYFWICNFDLSDDGNKNAMPETESMKQNKFDCSRELMKQRMEIIRSKRF